MKTVELMSKAPVTSWPKSLLTGQVALLLNSILGLNILDAAETAAQYSQDEAVDFIRANTDIIEGELA